MASSTTNDSDLEPTLIESLLENSMAGELYICGTRARQCLHEDRQIELKLLVISYIVNEWESC